MNHFYFRTIFCLGYCCWGMWWIIIIFNRFIWVFKTVLLGGVSRRDGHLNMSIKLFNVFRWSLHFVHIFNVILQIVFWLENIVTLVTQKRIPVLLWLQCLGFFRFLLQEILFPLHVPPQLWGAKLLLHTVLKCGHHAWFQGGVILLGIQGEIEVASSSQRKGEFLSLAGQRLAKFQALICHDKMFTFWWHHHRLE